MLYVVLATFAAGMATEYFLSNRWIGFSQSAYRLACIFSIWIIKTCGRKKEEEEKRAKRKERKQQHK